MKALTMKDFVSDVQHLIVNSSSETEILRKGMKLIEDFYTHIEEEAKSYLLSRWNSN